jgi:hypothetical protein
MTPQLGTWGQSLVVLSEKCRESEWPQCCYLESSGDIIWFGTDFRRFLLDVIARSDVMLVVIGDRWLRAVDKEGISRLDDPGDYVRIEIETALEQETPIIPLLVGEAPMPGTGDLPSSLQLLVHKNGTRIRPEPDFDRDTVCLPADVELE